MPLSYAKVISCSAICKHKGGVLGGGCPRARAESWCPVAGPWGEPCRRGAGPRAVGRRERWPVGTILTSSVICPPKVTHVPAEERRDALSTVAAGVGSGQGPCHGGLCPVPDRPPQLPWHSTRVPWPRLAPTHVAKHSRHTPFAFSYVGGRKRENHVGTSGPHRSTAASPKKAPSDLRKLQPHKPIVASDNRRAINTSVRAL